MKKVLLTVVAVMTMTVSFAQPRHFRHAEKAESYELNFDQRRLAVKLGLTDYQMEAMEAIHNNYNDQVASAASARGFQRTAMLHNAVRKDMNDMRRILNDEQFKTYMLLIGTTLQNQHLQ